LLNINLYKNKKQKLKITTILFLIVILLLPVMGYRVTLMTLKSNEMQKIRASNPQSGSVLFATPVSDYEGSILLLNAKDEETKTLISILQTERRNLERSLVYAMITRKFFRAVDDSYHKFSREERVFIDSIQIERKSKIEIDFYDIPLKAGSAQFLFYNDVLRNIDQIIGNTRNQSQQMGFMELTALKTKITVDTSKY